MIVLLEPPKVSCAKQKYANVMEDESLGGATGVMCEMKIFCRVKCKCMGANAVSTHSQTMIVLEPPKVPCANVMENGEKVSYAK